MKWDQDKTWEAISQADISARLLAKLEGWQEELLDGDAIVHVLLRKSPTGAEAKSSSSRFLKWGRLDDTEAAAASDIAQEIHAAARYLRSATGCENTFEVQARLRIKDEFVWRSACFALDDRTVSDGQGSASSEDPEPGASTGSMYAKAIAEMMVGDGMVPIAAVGLLGLQLDQADARAARQEVRFDRLLDMMLRTHSAADTVLKMLDPLLSGSAKILEIGVDLSQTFMQRESEARQHVADVELKKARAAQVGASVSEAMTLGKDLLASVFGARAAGGASANASSGPGPSASSLEVGIALGSRVSPAQIDGLRRFDSDAAEALARLGAAEPTDSDVARFVSAFQSVMTSSGLAKWKKSLSPEARACLDRLVGS